MPKNTNRRLKTFHILDWVSFIHPIVYDHWNHWYRLMLKSTNARDPYINKFPTFSRRSPANCWWLMPGASTAPGTGSAGQGPGSPEAKGRSPGSWAQSWEGHCFCRFFMLELVWSFNLCKKWCCAKRHQNLYAGQYFST